MFGAPGAALAGMVAAGAAFALAEGLAVVTLIWLVALDAGPWGLGALGAIALGVLVASSVLGGALVDRWGPRRVVVAATLVGAPPVALLALDAAGGAPPLWLVLCLAGLATLPDGAVTAPWDAFLPEAAARAGVRLEQANAAVDAANGVAAIANAPAAGILIAAVEPWAALAAAAGIGAVACALAAACLPRRGAAARRSGHPLAGLRFVGRRRDLALLAGAAAVLIAAWQAMEDVIAPAALAASGPEALGAALGAAGLSGAAGTVAGFAASGATPRRSIFIAAVAVGAAGASALALAPGPETAVLGLCALAFGAGAAAALVSAALQGAAPPRLRGRTLGAVMALSFALAAPFSLAVGALVSAAGVSAAAIGVAAILAGAAAIAPEEGALLQASAIASAAPPSADEPPWRRRARREVAQRRTTPRP